MQEQAPCNLSKSALREKASFRCGCASGRFGKFASIADCLLFLLPAKNVLNMQFYQCLFIKEVQAL